MQPKQRLIKAIVSQFTSRRRIREKLHLLTVAMTIILLRVLLAFASPPIQLGTNSRSASSDSPLFCDKAVHPLTDASCATPSFVTSTMRNRALPWIMRA